MATPQVLGHLSRGIDRSRVRGDAGISSLYELTNAFITIAGRVKKRDGFSLVAVSRSDDWAPALDPNTRGLFSAGGKLHTFYSVANVEMRPDVEYHRLPPPPGDPAPALVAIDFCGLYLGAIYAVAEFSDGSTWHYWLRSDGVWKANHAYREGQIIEPTSGDGMAYQATGDDHPQTWKPQQQYAIGDEVQPTEPNGYKYRLIDASGDNPASGPVEPAWPTTEDALVYEDVDNTSSDSAATGAADTSDRYSNLPGAKP